MVRQEEYLLELRKVQTFGMAGSVFDSLLDEPSNHWSDVFRPATQKQKGSECKATSISHPVCLPLVHCNSIHICTLSGGLL